MPNNDKNPLFDFLTEEVYRRDGVYIYYSENRTVAAVPGQRGKGDRNSQKTYFYRIGADGYVIGFDVCVGAFFGGLNEKEQRKFVSIMSELTLHKPSISSII